MTIDVKTYRWLVQFEADRYQQGGQELILNEVIACFAGCRSIALPFNHSDDALSVGLRRAGFSVVAQGTVSPTTAIPIKPANGLYFGTPTIVDDAPLFPPFSREWTKEVERQWVRLATWRAVELGYRRIVCGLGSGDIAVGERMQDMGGAEVVCYKHFGEFEDWVLVKEVA